MILYWHVLVVSLLTAQFTSFPAGSLSSSCRLLIGRRALNVYFPLKQVACISWLSRELSFASCSSHSASNKFRSHVKKLVYLNYGLDSAINSLFRVSPLNTYYFVVSNVMTNTSYVNHIAVVQVISSIRFYISYGFSYPLDISLIIVSSTKSYCVKTNVTNFNSTLLNIQALFR